MLPFNFGFLVESGAFLVTYLRDRLSPSSPQVHETMCSFSISPTSSTFPFFSLSLPLLLLTAAHTLTHTHTAHNLRRKKRTKREFPTKHSGHQQGARFKRKVTLTRQRGTRGGAHFVEGAWIPQLRYTHTKLLSKFERAVQTNQPVKVHVYARDPLVHFNKGGRWWWVTFTPGWREGLSDLKKKRPNGVLF